MREGRRKEKEREMKGVERGLACTKALVSMNITVAFTNLHANSYWSSSSDGPYSSLESRTGRSNKCEFTVSPQPLAFI